MTEVLHSPSNLPSSPSSLLNHDDNILQTQTQTQTQIIINQISEGETENNDTKEREEELSLLTLLIAVFRKSLVVCKTDRKDLCSMEIGWPTNVRHVTHVTFDRFNGFLGLPDEFEPEVPRRAPSASTTVFGVSTESMQLSYDSRGNSVPTILLLMQRRLYAQGGLRYEGVFRINAENSQEEYVRDQLNRGIVPDGIDVHCLAGLIKAWFRELPTGVLDSLTPEQVMQCQSEEDCVQLAKLLPPTEAALLDWAVNLMCDVVQEEQQNKMNARNVAMVFAPNMTQMADPLTALMYAVQVMNFLRNLITKTLRERHDSATKPATVDTHFYPPDRKDPENPPYPSLITFSKEETDLESIADKPSTENCTFLHEDNFVRPNLELNFEPATTSDNLKKGTKLADNSKVNAKRSKLGQSSHWSSGKSSRKMNTQAPIHVRAEGVIEKEKGISLVSRINSRVERVEAWR